MERLLTIRLTEERDIEAVMQMYAYSRSLMRAAGNTVQWTGYPTEEDIRDDIHRSVSYVVEQEGHPVATFALVPGLEPTYNFIDHGRWIDEQSPYVTVHRVAKTDGVSGIADLVFRIAK